MNWKWVFEEDDTVFKASGLSTGSKPTFGLKTAMHVYDNIEGVLILVKRNLLKDTFQCWRFKRLKKNWINPRIPSKTEEIQNYLYSDRQNQLHPSNYYHQL